ncbi:MAG: RNA polymerase subunit sigma-70 [Comamonadaceae bacterium]|nr:MAG: RNA polymerase subunit sigma-70 [Comamonadaceae bacterium]
MQDLQVSGFESTRELAGEYVLGTLSSVRRQEVEHRLPLDAELRAEIHAWESTLLPLTALARPVDPSQVLWQRIEDSIGAATVKVGVPVDFADTVAPDPAWAAPDTRGKPARERASAVSGWWSSLQLWRGLAGTGFAAAAIMAAVLVTRMGAPGAPQYMVVLVAPQATAPGWVVQASTTRELSLIPLTDTDVPAEKSLQFWTKADSWNGPVSLGLVKPGETITVPLDKLPPLQANQLFELTLEPVNGSPTNKPTGPIQFIGRAVKVI